MSTRRAAASLVLLCVAATSTPAHALQPIPDGWRLMLGGPLAFTASSAGDPHLALGLEASAPCFRCVDALTWLGAYADVVYDLGAEQTRVTLGPELGYYLVGFDGGLLLVDDRDATSLGLAGRAMLSMAFLHLYLRAGGSFGAHASTYFEVGLLWKLPVLSPD